MESIVFLIIIAICTALLLFGLIKHRFDIIVNFLVRVCVGLLCIYLLNWGLDHFNIVLGVGTNLATSLTIGLLGGPGLILVYAVAILFYI